MKNQSKYINLFLLILFLSLSFIAESAACVGESAGSKSHAELSDEKLGEVVLVAGRILALERAFHLAKNGKPIQAPGDESTFILSIDVKDLVNNLPLDEDFCAEVYQMNFKHFREILKLNDFMMNMKFVLVYQLTLKILEKNPNTFSETLGGFGFHRGYFLKSGIENLEYLSLEYMDECFMGSDVVDRFLREGQSDCAIL